jgi:diadenosine tetraphosphate (Ap4A) HIT family hydrolase
MPSCGHCEFDKTRLIAEDDFWLLMLNDNQATVGRVYFSLKRHETDVSKLTAEEVASLWRFIAPVKETLDFLFTPAHYNYLFHMNIDPHVHMHLYPRYEKPVQYWGEEFADAKFGGHYDPSEVRAVDDRLRRALVTDIRESVERCR